MISLLFYGMVAVAQDNVDISIIDDKLYVEIDGKEVVYPISKEDLKDPDQLINDVLNDTKNNGYGDLKSIK